jgi:hypothetical protein
LSRDFRKLEFPATGPDGKGIGLGGASAGQDFFLGIEGNQCSAGDGRFRGVEAVGGWVFEKSFVEFAGA